MTSQTITVDLHCQWRYADGKLCSSELDTHVHDPVPCANGKPERHHTYTPAETLIVVAAGEKYRIRRRNVTHEPTEVVGDAP